MIGVVADPYKPDDVAEFFELFKTPWEFVRNDSEYDVILSTSAEPVSASYRLLLIFRSGPTFFDRDPNATLKSRSGGTVLYNGRRIPIYGTLTTFSTFDSLAFTEESTHDPAARFEEDANGITVRVGYDLFDEVHFLLTVGQPAANAAIPTLDEHISALRAWITSAGIPLVEVPPVPEGYSFVTCLTHDIDHPAIRNHLCDHTMFGFLYRSTIGTWLNVLARRKRVGTLLMNLKAACLLPFVQLGIAKDFWSDFFDRYTQIEAGDAATYFVIPRGNYAGRTARGFAPSTRACRYTLSDIMPQLKRITSANCEVGVHGVDAWLDADQGRKEREIVSKATGATELGVRMHWLLFDEGSPVKLDRAGFTYDSTVGYRDTVGYRAGTVQAYRPLGATHLLELPLHVMDTALFYPNYLNLADDQAQPLVWRLIENAERMGGTFTVNWHDRSISPERLWENFYSKLLREVRNRNAWRPTASQAVAWFRKRRTVALETSRPTSTHIAIRASVGAPDSLPGLRLRVHMPRKGSLFGTNSNPETERFRDVPLTTTTQLTIPI